MQITLCEDDGIFHNGTPQIVIVVVKFDNGATRRIPYPADKPISALYDDLIAIAPQCNLDPLQGLIAIEVCQDPSLHPNALVEDPKPTTRPSVKVPAEDKSNIIEKEDIVTLVRLDEGRNKDASCDLIVGQEYRVISVKSTGVTLPGSDKITRMVEGYDVVNDHGDRPERTRVYPHEVALKSKRLSAVLKKELVISEILECPSCNTPNALSLEGSTYKGECTECQSAISIERIIKKCQTEKCNKEVSCFDIGGKYQGKCNQCLSVIEVPYA